VFLVDVGSLVVLEQFLAGCAVQHFPEGTLAEVGRMMTAHYYLLLLKQQ